MKVQSTGELRKRLVNWNQRLKCIQYPLFHFALSQFWRFLYETPVLAAILDEIQVLGQDSVKEKVRGLFDFRSDAKVQPLFGQDEKEQVTISYFVIKQCVEIDPCHQGVNYRNVEWEVARKYHATPGRAEQAWQSHFFNMAFVEPLVAYLDNQLDDQRAILALLRRYKHKCESFQRQHLHDLWSAKTSKGEELLAFHLYEYLHDQGVDLAIEPHSESGRVDMVAAQNTDDPLIADAKIFNLEKGKSYLCRGFHQIYQYTLDYNEPFGYLVIFKTCQEDLKFALTAQEQSVPFVTHNHKTIFMVTVDIYPHEKPASKRGYLKSVEITQDDLVRDVPSSNDTTETRKAVS